MDSFRSFLLIESLNISATPGLEEYIPQAKIALTLYLKRYGDNQELNAATSRFRYVLINYKSDRWSSEDDFYFKYDAIDKGKGSEEIITDKDDWRYGKTGKKAYKTPKDAIESIPATPGLAYRGMSWEEWRSIQKIGIIQSIGQHNFSNQNNLTFFAPKPDSGENYAGSFAPAAYKPTPTRPGVVIAVPSNLLKTPEQHSGIPKGELAYEGPLDAKNIVNAWMLVTTKVKPGTFNIRFDKRTKQVSEGSRMTVGIQYAIRQIK